MWDYDTSHEIIDRIDHVSYFTCCRSCLLKSEKNVHNTFIVDLSVLKYVLGNVQKKCLITHYQNHREFSIACEQYCSEIDL